MSSVFTKTRLRRRLSEVAAWTLGIVASAALATGVYTLAAAPFTTTIDDESALPKELATTSGNVSIPLPAELSPDARGGQDSDEDTEATDSGVSNGSDAEPTVTTGVPAQLQPGATSSTQPPAAPAPAPTQPQPSAPAPSAPPATPAPAPAPTQPPQTSPPTTAAPSNQGNGLAPIIDPVTGLVRGASNEPQEQQ